jgi:2-polyprenyl-3-methyl-5-hydroxy-6-metoxy-1,4-benzoquinol methylase
LIGINKIGKKIDNMKVLTNYPVAIDSLDHKYPCGTAHDNTTSIQFIQEVESYFNNEPIKYLDIGCSGGQLAVDFHNRGHQAIGIEGSDYSIQHSRANWPMFYNKVLYTCDATKPYRIVDDNEQQIKFDCITAWEVVEHIPEPDLDMFFTNIVDHMHDTSIFVGSINQIDGIWKHADGIINHHQSAFTKDVWFTKILNKFFIIHEYPFNDKVRWDGELTSFWVMLMKK